jgi:hypothetical protein
VALDLERIRGLKPVRRNPHSFGPIVNRAFATLRAFYLNCHRLSRKSRGHITGTIPRWLNNSANVIS